MKLFLKVSDEEGRREQELRRAMLGRFLGAAATSRIEESIGAAVAVSMTDKGGSECRRCRYCGQEIEANDLASTNAYWSGTPDVCHKACKDAGIRAEALDCQTIDADCNDCRHFKRGKLIPLPAHVQAQIDSGAVPGFTSQCFDGRCLRFDRPTVAFPNKWTGRECFEHRRAPEQQTS